jgi:hypothetical protein
MTVTEETIRNLCTDAVYEESAKSLLSTPVSTRSTPLVKVAQTPLGCTFARLSTYLVHEILPLRTSAMSSHTFVSQCLYHVRKRVHSKIGPLVGRVSNGLRESIP